MSETTPELDRAIQDWWVTREPPGGMATRWILAVEGLDTDGDEWLCFVWSKGLKTWQQKGLLHEALDGQMAVQVADEVRADE